MAKIYQLAQQVPSLKARLQAPQSPGEIRCSDCGRLVPLLDLGSHICTGGDGTQSTPRPDEGPQDNSFRKNARVAGLKIMTAAARTYSGVRSPQPASLSPAQPVTPLTSSSHNSSSSSSNLSPWPSMRKTSGTDATSVHSNEDLSTSPRLSPNSTNKLPFFEKYAKVYGQPGSGPSPVSPRPNQTSFSSAPLPNSSSVSSIATSSTSSTRQSSPDTSPDPSEASSNLPVLLDASKPGSNAKVSGIKPPSNLNQQRSITPNRGLVASSSLNNNLARLGMPPRSKSYDTGSLKTSQSEPLGLNQRLAGAPRPFKRSISPKATVAQLDNLLEDFSVAPPQTEAAHDDEDPFDLSSYMSRPASTSSNLTPRLGAVDTFTPSTKAAAPLSASNQKQQRPAQAASARSRCKQCRQSLVGDRLASAIEGEAGTVCGECYAALYLPKCRKCRKAIQGKATGSGDGKVKGKFHPECFTCFSCDEPFPNKEFYVWDERPFCCRHYHEMAGSMCRTCHTGIEGPCVTLPSGDELFKRYHPTCFQCSHATCKSVLTEYHYVVDERPYCEKHALALAGEPDDLPFNPKANGLPGNPAESKKAKPATRRIEKRRTIIAPVTQRRR